MFVPCLLRNSDSAYEELRVASDEYYPLKIRLRQPHLRLHYNRSNIFFVKKRNVQRFGDVPMLLSRIAHPEPGKNTESDLTTNPYLKAFANYLVRRSDPEFLSRIVEECVSGDAEEALALYLSVLPKHGTLPTGRVAWDLRLFRTYYQERLRLVGYGNKSKELLDPDLLLAYLHEMAERDLASEQSNDRESKVDAATRCCASLYEDVF